MSARGSLVADPGKSRAFNLISECARYIPVFWLALLAPEDLDEMDEQGGAIVDRKRAIGRAEEALPFFCEVFPEVPQFETIARSLIDLLKAKRCQTIGVILGELLEDWDPALPSLRMVVEIIDRRDVNFSLTVPARVRENPFTREPTPFPEKTFASPREVILYLCTLDPEDLTAKSEEHAWNSIVGCHWEKPHPIAAAGPKRRGRK